VICLLMLSGFAGKNKLCKKRGLGDGARAATGVNVRNQSGMPG
jgi:hypothetical protein